VAQVSTSSQVLRSEDFLARPGLSGPQFNVPFNEAISHNITAHAIDLLSNTYSFTAEQRTQSYLFVSPRRQFLSYFPRVLSLKNHLDIIPHFRELLIRIIPYFGELVNR